MSTAEYNFDGLVGPTHNYAGLAPGNLASASHRAQPSNPRAAALQGLDKMAVLRGIGVPQAVFPPPLRPHVGLLRQLGFMGDDAKVLDAARRDAPHLLAAAGSASAMWAANAATVGPSCDSADAKLHFTPANLTAALHRSIEAETTGVMLSELFPDPSCFVHHPPLPASAGFGDEGAANHTRLTPGFGLPGVQLFVHGEAEQRSQRFTPRQGLAASRAVARLHGLDRKRTVFAAQHPRAIDAGVFHNDVIAVGHRHVLLYHASAFADEAGVIDALQKAWGCACELSDSTQDLCLLRVTDEELSLQDAVASYLFNSQLVTDRDGRVVLIAPLECSEQPRTKAVIERLVEASASRDGAGIDAVHFVDVRQSMHNGGGPACLRLRVEMNGKERSALHAGVLFTETLERELRTWVVSHYRDYLTPDDLADPELLRETRDAHAALRAVMLLA